MRLSTAVLHVDGETVCGFVIVGENKSEALSVAEIALEHYETPGPKGPVEVQIGREGHKSYSFLVAFGSAGNVHISDVSPLDMENITRTIPRSPGFFICLASMQGNELKLISPSTFFLVKHDIELFGQPTILPFAPIDWDAIKEALAHS